MRVLTSALGLLSLRGTAAASAPDGFSEFTLSRSESGGFTVFDVYANFDSDGWNVLNVFDCTVTTDDGLGFHHSDLSAAMGGTWSPLQAMLIPSLSDPATDTYVTLNGAEGPTAPIALDPNMGTGVGATMPELGGWFNNNPSIPITVSGGSSMVARLTVETSRTASYVASGETFLSWTCTVGYNSGPAAEVHFGTDTVVWPEPFVATEDVHLTLGDGGHADFRGSDNGIYNMLSAKGLSVNALFRNQDFLLHENSVEFLKPEHNLAENALVHGTFMFGTYTAVRTTTGRLLHASVEAKETTQAANVQVYENGELVQNIEGEGQLLIDGVSFKVSKGLVTIRTSSWKVETTVVSGPRAYFVNLEMAPTDAPALQPVAPHGVIGQSFDGDNIAVDGATDKYNTKPGEVSTTSAQAEGAIVGSHEEYRMSSFFDTQYKYSRFDSTAAKPRDIKELTGKKHASRLPGKGSAMMHKELR